MCFSSSGMKRMRCPICEKYFSPEDGPALPFCSERCRQIDLGRWLDERYGLPYESPDAEEQPPENGAQKQA
jgi:uncharacterized protein